MAKSTRSDNKRKRALSADETESPDDLLEILLQQVSRIPRELGERRELAEECARGLHAHATSNKDPADHDFEPVHEMTIRRRVDAGLGAATRKVERHDGKRAPAGFLVRDGYLVGKARNIDRDTASNANDIARSIILGLLDLYWAKDERGKTCLLSTVVKPLLDVARPQETLAARHKNLLAAWERIAGRKWTDPAWARTLESLLRAEAYRRETQKKRIAARSRDGADTAVSSSPERLLASLRKLHGELPEGLNSSAIGALIEKTGLSPGGRHKGMDSRKVVEDFLAKLSRKKAMKVPGNLGKHRRGNSGG